MRALITNDDGIDSPGLLALAIAACDAGLDIVVAAPAAEASGSSASIIASEAHAVTAAGGHGRIRVTPRTLAGLDVPAYAVHAAPALIALLAAHNAFGEKPELVLSGINRGANVGRAIIHSGTVGAALTGGVNGARGLAVSLETGDGPPQWISASTMVSRILPAVLTSPVGTVLNFNIPDVTTIDGVDIVEAKLAPFGIVHTTMTKTDDEHVNLKIAEPLDKFEPDTDAALLASGHATITSVIAVREVPGFLTAAAELVATSGGSPSR